MPAARRLVALANRLPVSRRREGWHPSSGGLVTALRPALEDRGGAWVGWDGGREPPPRRVDGLDIDMFPVSLTRTQADGYYKGFSNRTLWPLLHGLVQPATFEGRWWQSYQEANERFAAASASFTGASPPLLWIHDYHLMLLPALLRRLHPHAASAFFLHTPFPAPELMARLPWRRAILEGVLGADLVAFHTERYRHNFVEACSELVPGVTVKGDDVVSIEGRSVRTAAHPISIDAAALAAEAASGPVERSLARLRSQVEPRRVVLGVDRLDYTKGIFERLRAIGLLLERRPDLRGRLRFVQVAVPSRGDVREYRRLRTQVEEVVGHLNGRFTEPAGAVPVHYLHRGLPRDTLLAYYRLADVALVTPLADGMNLVAKEFVVAQAATGGSGALVLSEFAGAGGELREAVFCNPFDVEGLSKRIEEALECSQEERRRRLSAMAGVVQRHDVFAWANGMLGELEDPARSL